MKLTELTIKIFFTTIMLIATIVANEYMEFEHLVLTYMVLIYMKD